MSESLAEFLSNINSLLNHLKYEKESQLFFRKGVQKYTGNSVIEIEFKSFVNKTVDINSFLQAKVYSYQNAIISLYGYLERFIEDRVVEYLKSISNICPEYKFLPPSIKKNHLVLSLELINKLQKLKGLTDEKRTISLSNAIGNMNDFFRGESIFKINYDAYINHTSNFRYDTIHEFFSKVGIDGISRKCLKNKTFVTALCQNHNIQEKTSHKVLISLLMMDLDDLAQRRNEIAHGARIDDIESIDITVSRINLVKEYVEAVDQVVLNTFEKYAFSVSPNLCLGRPSKIFPKLNVIGFAEIIISDTPNLNNRISVNDIIFAINDNSLENTIAGKIISLHKDGKSQTNILLPSNKPVTIGVNFNISTNFEKRYIYIVPCV